ncbi:MAG: hypothetical protein KAT01_00415 [Candidatus Aminicenantes bacterium]|nr:hypothetical protein [Candidatus Aminicenantes bacterium]
MNEKPDPITNLSSEIPTVIEQVVGRALEKNPDDRYQQIDDLLDDLRSISEGIVPEGIRARLRKAKLLRRKRACLYGGVAALFVLLFVAGLYFFAFRGKAIASIAVLPFEDLSPQKDQEYFCDGLGDELIYRLINIESLRVPARTSSFSFKGKEVSIQEIGKKLNVDTVLAGSLRKAGAKIRITVQLVKVADGYPLWSEKYERGECVSDV